MEAPFVVYADFESLIRKIHGCAKKDQATAKTELHEPCGFSYITVRSDGQTHGPYLYCGEDVVYKFLESLQYHVKLIKAELADKKPIVMAPEGWQKFNSATECHICNEKPGEGGLPRRVRRVRPQHGQVLRPKPQKMLLQRDKRVRGPKKKQAKGPDSEACIF